jgi:hypothetical protein
MPVTSRSKQHDPPQRPLTACYSIIHEPSSPPTPHVVHAEDEWSDVDWSFYLWCGLSCLVAGLVDGASLAGVYREATSHMSGMSTKLALRLHAGPPDMTTALASNLGVSLSYWGYIMLVCAFSLGSLVSGLVLTDCDAQGEHQAHVTNVTLGSALDPKHRLLIAATAILLTLSSIIMHCLDGHVCFFDSCSSPYAIFNQTLLSMMLTSCACGVLNGLTSSCKVIVFRASHMTGTLTDACLLIGHAIRAGSLPRQKLTRILVGDERKILKSATMRLQCCQC